MAQVVVALGSNIPSRKKNLRQAVYLMADQAEFQIKLKSQIYETAPVGGPPQGPFLNAALVMNCELLPHEILEVLLEIEKKMGRKRTVLNGPRIIDLDIVFYNDTILDDKGIKIPHPRFRERGFVLYPIGDIIPAFVDPETGKTVQVLLKEWRQYGREQVPSVGKL